MSVKDDLWKSRKFSKFDAREIFEKNIRFDLIFKYLYVISKDTSSHDFYKAIYLESLKAFNGFYEKYPYKSSPEDFLISFDATIASIMAEGFDESKSQITITESGELYDGAHRLVILAHLGLQSSMGIYSANTLYNYSYFVTNGLPEWILDLGALEFVKNSKYAYLATVHSCVPEKLIPEIEKLFFSYGKIYYRKDVNLNFNGYVHLKKISYPRNEWVGSEYDGFSGAVNHAEKSYGNNPVRVYVLVFDSAELLSEVKAKVRELCGLGNYSIHATDNQHEALELGKYLLSNNSISFLNASPIEFNFDLPPKIIKKYKSLIKKSKYDIDNFCVVGSYSLFLHHLRVSRDLDYISTIEDCTIRDIGIDKHEDSSGHYLCGLTNQILDPRLYFSLFGIKFITLSSLLQFKSARGEVPKDLNDISLILAYMYKTCSNSGEYARGLHLSGKTLFALEVVEFFIKIKVKFWQKIRAFKKNFIKFK